MTSDAPGQRAITDTRAFKVMRTLVGLANPLMRRMIASRFGGPLARNILLLEFRGRRTGKPFRTPVGYVRDGDRIVIVTSPTYRWWKNVGGGAPVRVRVAEGWRTGHARVLLPDDPAYDGAVATQVGLRGPGMLRSFGVAVDDNGRLDPDARAAAPSRAHIVEIALDPTAP